jgi:prepilin-type N-terminal cleavage/methylation domain-containing protein
MARLQRGFTLLEVVVALGILGLVLGALVPMMSSSAGQISRSRDDLTASLLAQSILDRIGGDIPLNPGAQSGQAPDGKIWELTLRPYRKEVSGVTSSLPSAVEVELKVRWSRLSRWRLIELHTIRLVPRQEAAQSN